MAYECKHKKKLSPEKTLNAYKREKVDVLHELGYDDVTISVFDDAKTEIAVDNICLGVVKGNKFICYPRRKKRKYAYA